MPYNNNKDTVYMQSILPFRYEHETTSLSKLHPLTRFLIPFILVIPFLIVEDIYLIFTILFFTIIIVFFFRLKILRILSKLKSILLLTIFIVIFLPIYIGDNVLFQINIGIPIYFYQEGLELAFFLFFRIFTSIFVFMSFFSTLTYSDFIEALTKLKLPSIFVGSLIIFLHYIPILANSNKKILEAQELRGKKITSYWVKLKTHAFIMGKSVLVNMERSERIYASLKMRGFTGKITFAPRGFKMIDVSVLLLFISLMIINIFFIDLKQIYMGVMNLFYL